ncbi:MAG: cytosolic protein [Planctomycetota bacterium]
MSPTKPLPRKDEDSAWKHILEVRLREFLAFYFPSIARRIDWSGKPAFLKQELQRILPRSEGRKHIVDALARTRLRDGGEAWLLIHVEVFGKKAADLAERTYVCRYRIFDRYRERAVSLAVYTGKGEAPAGLYEEKGLGDRLTLRFPVVSVESFRGRMEDLERSRNPFAVVTLAHLALGSARTARERLERKKYVVGRLYEQGFSGDDIIEVYRFLDWLVALPPPLEREYERHVDRLERRTSMPLLSLREERAIRRGLRKGLERGLEQGIRQGIERGLEQGLEQGLERGLREAVERGLELRFGAKGRKLIPRVDKLEGLEALRRVHEALFKARRLEEIARLLPRARRSGSA